MSRALHDDTARLATILEWREPLSPARVSRALVGSIAFHFLFFLIYLATPSDPILYRDAVQIVDIRQSTPLYLPKSLELTQRDPNPQEEVNQQLDIRSALPSVPSVRDFRPPALPGPVAVDEASPALEAPPEIDPIGNAGVPDAPLIAGLPAPVAAPKIVIEDVSPAPSSITPPENPAIRTPRASVEDAVRAARDGLGGGGGLNTDGTNSQPSSAPEMQLLSDPQGVDFKPYLLQVLASVRQNWFSVIPDAARTGRAGQTLIQFIIDREGAVPKLVIARPSGTAAFDRAAVASISASYPFPPLPAEYGGQEIRLQLAFTYNLPTGR